MAENGSVYHEFLLSYRKRGKVIYGFVEGREDPCFYRNCIQLLIPRDWKVELWPAGGKDHVLDIHRAVDWRRFPKRRICFFVDRDLSDLTEEKIPTDVNIYVTDGYSIENDIVNREVCHRVLTELCGFGTAKHDELEKVCDMFEEELDAFLRMAIPIMAWLVVWRRLKMRPKLAGIRLKDVACVKNARLRESVRPGGFSGVVEYLHAKCDVELKRDVDIASVTEELEQGEQYKRITRGKFVFWFLIEFCNSVHRDAASLFGEYSSPPKMRCNLSCANGMALIAVRARVPGSIRKFLGETHLAFIRKTDAVAA